MWLRYSVFFVFGFCAGFGTLLVLFLAYGDYGDQPVANAPVVAQVVNTPAPLATAIVLPTATTRPAPASIESAPSLDTVLSAFESAGIQLRDINRVPQIEAESPLPRSFRYHATWKDALLGDSGGQVFICDSPDLCVALSSYFRMLVGMAGPYIYISPSGLVVAQLNSSFTPDQATRYRAVLAKF